MHERTYRGRLPAHVVVSVFVLCLFLPVSFSAPQATLSPEGFQLPENMRSPRPGWRINEFGLNESEISAILSLVVNDVPHPGVDRAGAIAFARQMVRVTHMDMGEGYINGLVAYDSLSCGSRVENCETWFLGKVNDKWKDLFPLVRGGGDPGLLVASFAFTSSKNNGLYDLVTASTGGRPSQYPTVVWRFNGSSYVSVENYCWFREPGADKIEQGRCH